MLSRLIRIVVNIKAMEHIFLVLYLEHFTFVIRAHTSNRTKISTVLFGQAGRIHVLVQRLQR